MWTNVKLIFNCYFPQELNKDDHSIKLYKNYLIKDVEPLLYFINSEETYLLLVAAGILINQLRWLGVQNGCGWSYFWWSFYLKIVGVRDAGSKRELPSCNLNISSAFGWGEMKIIQTVVSGDELCATTTLAE